MQDEMMDLSRLNEVEREILRLLAQGHTVKSVAALIDRSVGSVNERLRHARRKTGASSSRALSRILAAQENWDEIIGIDPTAPFTPDLAKDVGQSRSALSRGITMIIIAATALTAGAYLLQGTAPVQTSPREKNAADPAKADPLLAGSFPGPSPAQLYVMVRTEKRDAPWADATEKALTARYAILLRKYGVSQPVRALCGAKHCEVAMKLNLSLDKEKKLTEELQHPDLYDALAKLGLKGVSSAFGGPDKSYVHSSYWTRVSALNAAPAGAGPAPASR